MTVGLARPVNSARLLLPSACLPVLDWEHSNTCLCQVLIVFVLCQSVACPTLLVAGQSHCVIVVYVCMRVCVCVSEIFNLCSQFSSGCVMYVESSSDWLTIVHDYNSIIYLNWHAWLPPITREEQLHIIIHMLKKTYMYSVFCTPAAHRTSTV